MDIYCSTCGEPFELYIETDEDRQECTRRQVFAMQGREATNLSRLRKPNARKDT